MWSVNSSPFRGIWFHPIFYLSWWCSCCWCCQITHVHVFRSMLWCSLRIPSKNDVRFILKTDVLYILFVFIYVYWCPTRLYFRWCSCRLTVIRRESHVEQELLTLLEHLRSPLWGSCRSIFGYLCNVLLIVVFLFVLFILAIVLSVLLRVTTSDYPFYIFKLFIYPQNQTVGPRDLESS